MIHGHQLAGQVVFSFIHYVAMKMKHISYILFLIVIGSLGGGRVSAQINTDQVMRVGQNSLYLEDYVLSIQYFNQVIAVKPYLAQPYSGYTESLYHMERQQSGNRRHDSI